MEDAHKLRDGPALVGDGTRSGRLSPSASIVPSGWLAAECAGTSGSGGRNSHAFWHLRDSP